MTSADAMIVWTPDREPFEGKARGQIRAVTIPEPAGTRQLACSVGACDDGWKQKTADQRVDYLERLKAEIVAQDNIAEPVVHEALRQVDEYRARYP